MLTSCEESTQVSKPLLNFYESVPIFKIEPEVDWSFVTGRVIFLEKTVYNDSNKTENTKKEVNGMLYTDVANYVDGGGLKVNKKWVKLKSVESIYGYKDPVNELFSFGKAYNDTMSILYDGFDIPVSLTGNKNFEAFSLNVKSPQKKLTLIQPISESEINIGNDYKVKWNSGNDTNANVRIVISNGINKELTYYGKDKGEHIILKTYLDYLGIGKFNIEIISGNYAITKLSTGFYAIAIVGSSYKTVFYLK
ncbi:MAG: hypothetical protein NTW25_03220 [Candidatus Kapabacteria bacterium]|nr:hypothetical protein [Candidatus Kapabacteria bacterium]